MAIVAGILQIGVAVHVNHADVAEIAAGPGNRRKSNRTIAAQNHGQRAGFYGLLDARLQRFERRDHARNVARAGTFVVNLKKLGRIIAKIVHFVANRAEAVNQSGGAQRRRCAFEARDIAAALVGEPKQGNLIRLADDFGRHSVAP